MPLGYENQQLLHEDDFTDLTRWHDEDRGIWTSAWTGRSRTVLRTVIPMGT
jgi:hypothetical protein